MLNTKIVTFVLMALAVALAVPIFWVLGLSLVYLMTVSTTAGTGGIATVAGGISLRLLSLTIAGAMVIVLLGLLLRVMRPRRR